MPKPGYGPGVPEYMKPRDPETWSPEAQQYWDDQLVTEEDKDLVGGEPGAPQHWKEPKPVAPTSPAADQYWDDRLAQTAGEATEPRAQPTLMAQALRGAQQIDQDARRGATRIADDASRGVTRTREALGLGGQRVALADHDDGMTKMQSLAEEMGRLKERLGQRRSK